MTISEIVKRFGKSKLLALAEELEISDIVSSTHSFAMVSAIKDNLYKEGVPEDEDMSDDLYDFCIAAGLLDSDGNVVEEDDDETGCAIETLPDVLPACWGMIDESDTACKKCPISNRCAKQRILVRPRCYGVLFHRKAVKCNGDEEHEGCLEYYMCQEQYAVNKAAGTVK